MGLTRVGFLPSRASSYWHGVEISENMSYNLPEFPPITDPSPALPLLVGVSGGFRLAITDYPLPIYPLPITVLPITYYLLPITVLPISKVKNLPL
ncbi:hypothetical protein BJP34_34485 [Moorena producens PAL-8-15-08-1]|uniref:Uncharacterized protein n=1 Tax=Moorena producens PAL-8-15-08-1 TaxID=1458985 RepID=A0A1D8U1T9_9CYAN|nr:hypothetical protein BJP34_34485 [Moorena producens PAL-8-15-08-1]